MCLATMIILTVQDSLHLRSKSKVLVLRRTFLHGQSVMYKFRLYVGAEILFPCKFWLLKIDGSDQKPKERLFT